MGEAARLSGLRRCSFKKPRVSMMTAGSPGLVHRIFQKNLESIPDFSGKKTACIRRLKSQLVHFKRLAHQKCVGTAHAIYHAFENSPRIESAERKKNMTTQTKTKPIKAVLGFSRLPALGLQERINAVLDGLYADPEWTVLNPPIDKATFKEAADKYASLCTAALDGSRKAIAARNHQATIIV